MTRYPDLFAALCADFEPHEVKQRRQAGRTLDYVTARTIMNRLDTVLGPENWYDDYVPGEHSVLCRLTIILPDLTKLTKSDAGGYAGMQDEGDDDKSGYSDAFKRASVKFGIGRYLYRDGVPNYAPARVQDDARPKIRVLDRRIKDTLELAEAQFNGNPNTESRTMPVTDADVLRHLYRWAKDNLLFSSSVKNPETIKACRHTLNDLYEELGESKRKDMLAEIGNAIATRLIETCSKSDE